MSAAAAQAGEGWAGQIRIGLYTVLSSRVGQQQRHSALCLAAAVLELVQPQWLLAPVNTVSRATAVVFAVRTVSHLCLLYCHEMLLMLT